MFSLLASCLTLLLVVACSGASSTPKSPWTVQLNTSGGFVGIGNGNLSLNSEGKFKYEQPAPPSQPRKPCEGTLSTRELRPVDDAVRQSQPKEWNRPGLKVAAPDAFGYQLDLRTGSAGQTFRVQWYDNTRDQLPADLRRLSEALIQARKTAAGKCRK